jgi:signal transduction histidine kinase
MSSGTRTERFHTAAWRISMWAGAAFACGTFLVFIWLHRFVAADIQRRSDAWLTGEVQVLSDVAEQTPRDRRYSAVVSEVAELASREVPNRLRSSSPSNDSVFFLQAGQQGNLQLWVGSGEGGIFLNAISSARWQPNVPADIEVPGNAVPFRVASVTTDDGGHIYLGLSERDELHVLRSLRIRFIAIGAIIVGFGFLIVFAATRRMLRQVQRITAAASRIGQSDIRTRVPVSGRHDEIGLLSKTLNGMLDRIESSMHQLHTITDSLAHDLRSPLTAVRGKLELALASEPDTEAGEQIVAAIEELDRLSRVLTTSLDVAEADANALRLRCERIELVAVVQDLVELYEPSMAERDLHIGVLRDAPVYALADSALLHRLIANLLDNEMKHIPAGSNVTVQVQELDGHATMIWEDDGPGFGEEVRSQLFETRAKGTRSAGYGLGLAFVQAVTRAQGGFVTAGNRAGGGARLVIALPLAHPNAPVAGTQIVVSA